jgi:hypothetical protein
MNTITLKFGDAFEVSSDQINAKGLAYLLQYGVNQSMSDSIAGLEKKVRADIAKYRKDIGEDAEAMNDDEVVESVIDAKLAERWNAILEGTVGIRAGGTRLTGEAKFTRDVAIEFLKALAASKKVSLPKEADKLNALVEKYLANADNAAKVADEVKRRMALQSGAAASDEFDIESLVATNE